MMQMRWNIALLGVTIYILLINICEFVGLDNKMLECQWSSNSVLTLGFGDLSGKFWHECKREIISFEVSMKGMTTVSTESSVYKTFLVFQLQQPCLAFGDVYCVSYDNTTPFCRVILIHSWLAFEILGSFGQTRPRYWRVRRRLLVARASMSKANTQPATPLSRCILRVWIQIIQV